VDERSYRAELALPTKELYLRARRRAARRLDVRFFWTLLRTIPAAEAAVGELEEAQADVRSGIARLNDLRDAGGWEAGRRAEAALHRLLRKACPRSARVARVEAAGLAARASRGSARRSTCDGGACGRVLPLPAGLSDPAHSPRLVRHRHRSPVPRTVSEASIPANSRQIAAQLACGLAGRRRWAPTSPLPQKAVAVRAPVDTLAARPERACAARPRGARIPRTCGSPCIPKRLEEVTEASGWEVPAAVAA
jgi:hypothetical protein